MKDARRKYWELDPLFGRAMVILRNPINAIPSYFNLQYGESISGGVCHFLLDLCEDFGSICLHIFIF